MQGYICRGRESTTLTCAPVQNELMSDLTPHTLDQCIFSRSDRYLFSDITNGRIVESSEAANTLLRSSPTGERKEGCPDSCSDLLEAVSVQGLPLSDVLATPEQFLQEGIIQPTELISRANSDYSKWVYGCAHASKSADGRLINVIYLHDAADVKREYTSVSRSPVKLEDVKKTVSADTPDFVTDGRYVQGEVLSLKLSKMGQVIELFPFNASFMGMSTVY